MCVADVAGQALDGKPKLDLEQFKDECFLRLRHPPNGANNINGIDGDPDGGKVILPDVDHAWLRNFAQWPSKSFTRGLGAASMDLYGVTRIGDRGIKSLSFVGDWIAGHEAARGRMGYTRSLADRVDLAAMSPRPDLCSTGYRLAAPGKGYVVYRPDARSFSPEPEGGALTVIRVDTETGEISGGDPIIAGNAVTFASPVGGEAALHLRAEGRSS